MNRKQRRINAAIQRKSSAIGYFNGQIQFGCEGSKTQSNRSRPHVVYKPAKGNRLTNTATKLLAALNVGIFA